MDLSKKQIAFCDHYREHGDSAAAPPDKHPPGVETMIDEVRCLAYSKPCPLERNGNSMHQLGALWGQGVINEFSY